MLKRISFFIVTLLFLFSYLPSFVGAETLGTKNILAAEPSIDRSITAAEKGDLQTAQREYQVYRVTWFNIEDSVKTDSPTAYSDIESNMGQIEYAFLQKKQTSVSDALHGLQNVIKKYVNGQYPVGDVSKKENITLSDFIQLVHQANDKVLNHDQKGALQAIAQVQQSWLSIEGVVVAQSSSIYNNTERDMVTAKAMISQNDFQGASTILDKMGTYLKPLAGKSTYSMWDAALIPIREGLEALLVVAALLAYVKKSTNGKGKGWIWSGVGTGLILSIILAVIVKFVFSSGAFGNNNFLISGWTGVLAAVMLFFVSYWLHNQANIKDWQQFIGSKSKTAMDTGRLVSLGVLAFLAIFREGTETVLFLIGMVNQISLQNLLLGLLLGFGILAILAFFMLFIGVRLPLKPFFMVSSIIVFYLCLKFTGMGIHSLQLAGLVPSTTAQIPNIDLIALYPSWQSAVPQLVLVILALIALIQKKRSKAQNA